MRVGSSDYNDKYGLRGYVQLHEHAHTRLLCRVLSEGLVISVIESLFRSKERYRC